MEDQKPDTVVASEGELRSNFGEPMDIALKKQLGTLDVHCKDFISRSPFLCLGTSAANGKADVSPRGDPPGFVQILDDNTIFIPDRPGNNRLDSMSNIVENPNVGILFMIPGYEDALRVNGKATIVKDQKILERCAVNRKIPQLGIMVDVKEAYLHCAKALRRSKIWRADAQQDRKDMPTLAQMILEQASPADKPPTKEEIKEGDDFVEDNYKTGLY